MLQEFQSPLIIFIIFINNQNPKVLPLFLASRGAQWASVKQMKAKERANIVHSKQTPAVTLVVRVSKAQIVSPFLSRVYEP